MQYAASFRSSVDNRSCALFLLFDGFPTGVYLRVELPSVLQFHVESVIPNGTLTSKVGYTFTSIFLAGRSRLVAVQTTHARMEINWTSEQCGVRTARHPTQGPWVALLGSGRALGVASVSLVGLAEPSALVDARSNGTCTGMESD